MYKGERNPDSVNNSKDFLQKKFKPVYIIAAHVGRSAVSAKLSLKQI